jgi:hypothetical protein
MRGYRFTTLTLLFVLLPMLSLAKEPSTLLKEPHGFGFFTRTEKNADKHFSIAKAKLTDTVYFGVAITIANGDHVFEVTVYDGSGREVYRSENAVFAKARTVQRLTHYGFDPSRDVPGEWWYVASIDKQIVVSMMLPVSR